MKREKFEALVANLEKKASQDPAGYQVKVLLLALLGNVYVFAILLFLVALLLALLASVFVLKALAVKLIIVVAVFLGMVVKALWVKVNPPEGTDVNAEQAPRLFALIDELRRALKAPAFHRVLIDDKFNAGVAQTPSFGIFGPSRNDLILGLPLMKWLTDEQFKAVLAHEFGHLSKGHGRVSNWLYRQRLRWGQLLDVLEASESRGSFLFKPFLRRFAPYFNAYSFPLARANEYEADATSVRLTSPATAAEALTVVNVAGSFLDERYWPQIYKEADNQPTPSFAPYFKMGSGLAAELHEENIQAWLEQAMALPTTSADTHPALNDRLKAIGQVPHLVLPRSGQAADRLLGSALEPITKHFDERWREAVSSSWQERYEKVQKDRGRLAELNAKVQSGAVLTMQERYDRAHLMETAGNDPEGALAELRALHQSLPDDPWVCFALGARLLYRNDEAGVTLVERAMQLDENLTADVCEVLRDYHWRNDRKETADDWHNRLIERLQLQEAAQKERSQVLINDKFEAHGLSESELENLQKQLKTVPGLRVAYFMKKRVRYFADRPFYVLGFRCTGIFQRHNAKRAADIVRQIRETVEFPGEALIFCVEGENYRFGRKFRMLRGSRIL